jgi:hypothetical protein
VYPASCGREALREVTSSSAAVDRTLRRLANQMVSYETTHTVVKKTLAMKPEDVNGEWREEVGCQSSIANAGHAH